MKYFLAPFVFVILFAYSLDSNASTVYSSYDNAKAACTNLIETEFAAPNKPYRPFTGGCGSKAFGSNEHGSLWALWVKVLDTGTIYNFPFYDSITCPSNHTINNGICVADPTDCPVFGPSEPSCLCSDGLPKHSGQWTTCDRPALIMCEFLGRPTLPKDCPSFELPDSDCPTDTTLIDGQCVNKCGKNSVWNAVLNKCELIEPPKDGGSCPKDYTQDQYGNCIPNSCPPKYKLVIDTCVLDTEPKIDSVTEKTTNPDGTTTETTTETTTVNNPDGTTTTTTVITVIKKDAEGNITGVDVVENEKTEGEDENKPEVSGGSDCLIPPACSGDAIGCAQINMQWKTACLESDDEVTDTTNCETAFVCSGSVFECESLKIKNKNYCERTAKKVNEFTQTAGYKTHFDANRDLDENGVLKTLTPDQINIGNAVDFNAVLNTTGRSGSCPDNISRNVFGADVSWDYQPICTTAIESKPIFLFFVGFFCFGLVAKSLTKSN